MTVLTLNHGSQIVEEEELLELEDDEEWEEDDELDDELLELKDDELLLLLCDDDDSDELLEGRGVGNGSGVGGEGVGGVGVTPPTTWAKTPWKPEATTEPSDLNVIIMTRVDPDTSRPSSLPYNLSISVLDEQSFVEHS
jgi:hypothetical protein